MPSLSMWHRESKMPQQPAAVELRREGTGVASHPERDLACGEASLDCPQCLPPDLQGLSSNGTLHSSAPNTTAFSRASLSKNARQRTIVSESNLNARRLATPLLQGRLPLHKLGAQVADARWLFTESVPRARLPFEVDSRMLPHRCSGRKHRLTFGYSDSTAYRSIELWSTGRKQSANKFRLVRAD